VFSFLTRQRSVYPIQQRQERRGIGAPMSDGGRNARTRLFDFRSSS
jgi:hypothetical protein